MSIKIRNVTNLEVFMISMLMICVIIGAIISMTHHAASAYAHGLDRTRQNIVNKYSSKPNFSGISLESARKFTTAPDIVASIDPYTSVTENDGFAIGVRVSEVFCKDWLYSYRNYEKTIINGKSFPRIEKIKEAVALIAECRSGLNEISLIYARPKIAE